MLASGPLSGKLSPLAQTSSYANAYRTVCEIYNNWKFIYYTKRLRFLIKDESEAESSELDEEDCNRRRSQCIDEMTTIEKQFMDIRDQYGRLTLF